MIRKKLISVVVPVFNEAGTVGELHRRLVNVLRSLGNEFEIIFIDDGSMDGTFEELKKLSPLTAIKFRRNYGQSRALGAGIEKSKGDIIVLMDGDLENRPEDIPALVNKLGEGFHLVSGWRKERWAKQRFARKLPSLIANKLISFVVGIDLHDHGCTLKAYDREILKDLVLQGEGHRLIAAYAAINGAKIAETQVGYDERKYGKSKYGIMRTFKVLVDVVALLFFHKYADRPMHFFGGFGFFSFFLSFLSFLGMLYFKFVLGASFILTPLPILCALFAIVGIQFILMGLLAEIIVRKIPGDTEEISLIEEEIKK